MGEHGVHEGKLGRPHHWQNSVHDVTYCVSQLDKSWSNFMPAPVNMEFILVTVAKEVKLTRELNAVALENILLIVVTLEVSISTGWLKLVARKNIALVEFTLAVSFNSKG